MLNVDQGAEANIGIAGDGTLDVGVSGNNASNGTVNVASGGQLNAHALRVGSTFTSAATGLVTVDGASSTIDVVANLEVGSSANGSGTIDITGDGTLNVNGVTTVNATGAINVTDGAFSASDDVLVDGGDLFIAASSTFDLVAGRTLTASNGGLLDISGSSFELDDGKDAGDQ